ncbi:YojF family protein [Alkalicoccobacillus murimartini]|uniref:DUF1806 domain-containing protein n=1 Tax=Alkalicoccobacillus murimartini TaxID=171685 RepID=A0ABT9YGH4_9BACI|nr:YojF family protein [Alkalicoccobacillus murimartini]MDQ0206159.1 hypothetical protein [Alkalicoccobacillus murimartini]
MKPIITEEAQQQINKYANTTVYIHLETTNGAYATHNNADFFSASAYIRNAKVHIEHGKILGEGPYRVGLKIDIGWVYAEGLTHVEADQEGRLLFAGHGAEGKLAVALQISQTPFE